MRKAIYFAIDRQSIATDLLQGTVTVATTPINPLSPYYNANTIHYDYDVDTAKQMLDAAGWTVGSDGVRVKGGKRFSFTMLNRAGRSDRIAIAQVIQAELKEVGIEVLMDTKESAAWTGQWRTGNWDAIVAGWFLTADPSVTNLYSCKGANNMTGYCDAKLDDVMTQSDQALDFAVRKPLLDQAQTMLAEDAVDLPIYFNPIPISVSNKMVNFKGSGTNLGSFWNWYRVGPDPVSDASTATPLAGKRFRGYGTDEHNPSAFRTTTRKAEGPGWRSACCNDLTRRLLQMIPLLLGISLIMFALIQSAPGGPEAVFL